MKYAIALLLCFLVANAYGQISYGAKAGLNINRLYSRGAQPPFSDERLNLGFHFGLFGTLPLSTKTALQAEFQFIQKWYSHKYDPFNYLEIPVLLNYKLSEKISVQLGSSFASKIFLWNDQDLALGKYQRDINFSALAGLQLKASKKVAIVPRVSYSILPLEKGYYIDQNNNPVATDPLLKFTNYLASAQLSALYYFN